ncbi:MAG: tRNA threonylcarbamoyladenosine dehydratase [Prevotellaceae bacterium]|jgi:tRNA A37 threonylcarbamoyladenosine dehydratase|nr:tRNA threonylcarbamoyladenosine dehydratase [Prevotellaceae bacterium]
MGLEQALFKRTELLLGAENMSVIGRARVILFGVGGVGSWCAESLVRSGIRQLTIVDSDRVCITNVNRQLQATTKTVGQVKVEALKTRLHDINPEAAITAVQAVYDVDTSSRFELQDYDVIIDAIDSLTNKIHLIRAATRTDACFVSSMGAALKIDPARVRVAEFWQVEGCPLGAIIRKKIRKGELPAKKFLCVYSDERLDNLGADTVCGTERCFCPKDFKHGQTALDNHEWCSQKAQINGAMVHITAIFGFTLAGLVMQHLCRLKD